MEMPPVARSRRLKRPAVKAGRPPRELAGDVDDRILDAAHRMFLEHGLSGASIDEIARVARAGKQSLYARFPTKEALFTAVAMRNAAKVRAGFAKSGDAPAGTTVEEHLIGVATTLLNRLMAAENIDFMRLSWMEAPRFPELANMGRMARERGAQAVAQVLNQLAQSGELANYPLFAPERLAETTQFFLDLVVTHFLLRAISGENLKQLRTEIGTHVPRAVHFFLAGCASCKDE